MTYDKEQLEAMTTKEAIIEYAESFGITKLKKQRSVSNLKQDFVIAFNQLTPSKMEETAYSYSDIIVAAGDDTAPVYGIDNIAITKDGVEQIIAAGSLEDWCKEHRISYEIAKDLTIRTWLNIYGYSFKKV